MSTAHFCDKEQGCTFVVWEGDVTPDEWNADLDTIFADPAFPPGEKILADLRSAGGLPTITDEVIALAAVRLDEQPKLTGIHLAIVADGVREKAVQLAYREYAVPGFRAIVFSDLIGACQWLDVSVRSAIPSLARLRSGLRITH